MKGRLLWSVISFPMIVATSQGYAVASDEQQLFRDWQVDCDSKGCSARSYKMEGTIDGYPSLKITGTRPQTRKLIFADAKIMDGTKPVRIQVDGATLFHLSPGKDFVPVDDKSEKPTAYVLNNRALQKDVLLAMLAGGKMWITYTNVRGQIRYPSYSLMGMTAAMQALK